MESGKKKTEEEYCWSCLAYPLQLCGQVVVATQINVGMYRNLFLGQFTDETNHIRHDGALNHSNKIAKHKKFCVHAEKL